MNKIMEASEAVAKAYAKWWLYTPDDFTSVYYAKLELLRDALRAEVTLVEAEVVRPTEDMINTNGYTKKIESLIAERDELRAKIAAMEMQEPVAFTPMSVRDSSIGAEIAPVGWHDFQKRLDKFSQDPWVSKGLSKIVPLYLAPGAKP